MTRPTVAVDVDDVVLNLAERWLADYNERWNDDVSSADIAEWDLTTALKPACGAQIYGLIADGSIYDRVDPVPGALWGVATLKTFARVVFVTTAVGWTSTKKRAALLRYGFLEQETDPWHSKDFIVATDKTLIRADCLIDDAPHNVIPWGARGILFDAGRHKDFYAGCDHPRVDWPGAVERVIALTQPETVCAEADRLVSGPRQADYGHPYVNDARIAALWRAAFGWPVAPGDIWQAMVLTKLSRERTMPKRDNRVDIAGYAEVGEMVHQRVAAS